ncbi:MAG: hypothetical protein ACTSYR_05215 [Candidatus Odinarchaeia archaeon]
MKRRTFIKGLTTSIFLFKTIKPYWGPTKKIIEPNVLSFVWGDLVIGPGTPPRSVYKSMPPNLEFSEEIKTKYFIHKNTGETKVVLISDDMLNNNGLGWSPGPDWDVGEIDDSEIWKRNMDIENVISKPTRIDELIKVGVRRTMRGLN